MKKFLLLVCALCSISIASAAKKNVIVLPSEATIYLNGMEVGSGTYTINFDKNTEVVNLRFEAPGYITRTIRVLKNDPRKTISVELYTDEAHAASTGEEDGFDTANKWFTVNCNDKMSEEMVWKRLSQIAIDNFDQLEVRDKAAGWIRSGWATTRFQRQTVRTRLEIRIAFTDDKVTSYRCRLQTEIKDNDCQGKNCWQNYDRVLRKYEDVIQQLQTTLGANQ